MVSPRFFSFYNCTIQIQLLIFYTILEYNYIYFSGSIFCYIIQSLLKSPPSHSHFIHHHALLKSHAPPIKTNAPPLTHMEITPTTFASHSYSDLPSAASMPTRPIRVIPMQHPNLTSSSNSLPPNIAISRFASKLRGMTWLEWIEFLIPCSRWIRIYKWREYLQSDLMAGITVGVMLVPQVTLLLRYIAEKTIEKCFHFRFFFLYSFQ